MPSMTLLSSAVTRPASTSHTQGPTQKGTVYRFTCLFTHDVRRKNTKRWQDGYLSFHSFNGRVQVHDELKNFIGDTFYKDGLLDDGDELSLDRVGVLVQVGEKKAVEETDLTELLSKRQPKQTEQANSETGTAQPLRSLPSNVFKETQRRWTGWAARAQIPTESPHAQRQAAKVGAQRENEPVQEPPKKRPRQDDEHIPLLQLLKTTRPSRSQATSIAINRQQAQSSTSNAGRAAPSAKKTPKTQGRSMLRVKEIIDITDSSSDRIELPAPAVQQSGEQQRPSSVVTAGGDADKPQSPVKGVFNAQARPLPAVTTLSSPERVDDPGGMYNTPAAAKRAPSRPEDSPQPRPRVQAAVDRPRVREGPSLLPRGEGETAGEGVAINEGRRSAAAPNASVRNALEGEERRDAAGEQHDPPVALPKKSAKPKSRPSKTDIVRSATKAAEPPPQSLPQAPRSPSVCTTSHVAAEEIDPRQASPPSKVQKQPREDKRTKSLRLASASAPKKRKLFAQSLAATKSTAESPHITAFPSPQNSRNGDRNALKKQNAPATKNSRSKSPPRPPEAGEQEVITLLNDDDEHEAFEVMQPKAKRQRRLQREPLARSSTPKDRPNSVEEQTARDASSRIEEDGFPSTNNQPDQRLTPQAEAEPPPEQPIAPVTRISYGTAPLDAEYLSQMVANMGAASNASLLEQPAEPETVNQSRLRQAAPAEPETGAGHPLQPDPANEASQEASSGVQAGLQLTSAPDKTFRAITGSPRARGASPAPGMAPMVQPAQATLASTAAATTAPTAATANATTTTAPPLITAQAAASRKLTRPFRRVTSEVSPTKRPQAASKKPLKRAETISIPEERTRQQTHDEDISVPKEVGDVDRGAWSREAWDLFGGCPARRRERPLWPYDAVTAQTSVEYIGQ